MKLARVGAGGSLGLASAGAILDVGSSLPALAARDRAGAAALEDALGPQARGDWTALIERWDALAPVLQAMIDEPEGLIVRPLAETTLLPPLVSPTARVFALGGNFAKHLVDASRAISGKMATSEERRAQGPWGFLIIPDTIVGSEHEIRAPAGLEKLDYEGEVAVVLRTGGRAIAAGDLDVFGFTAFNDFSLRDTLLGIGPVYDRGMMTWTLQKNWDGGSSAGPWLVVDEGLDPGRVRITLRVNGETRQEGSTEEMIFSFGETAEHLSRFLTLRPGDVIASGTTAGTAMEAGLSGRFLRSGDVVELDVEGVGATLRNAVA